MHNYGIDRNKVIAEVFVVFIHVKFPGLLGECIRALARYAVPLFFLAAGYFCFYSDRAKEQIKIRKRIAWLAEVLVVSCLLFALWRIVNMRFQGEKIFEWLSGFSLREAALMLCFNCMTFFRGHLWYLAALLYLYIILLIVNRFHLYKLAYCMIGPLFAVQFVLNEGMAMIGRVTPLLLVQNFLVFGFPFFFLGYYIHAYEEKVMRFLPSRYWLVLASAAGGVLTFISWKLLGPRIGYQSIICYLGSACTAIALFLYSVKYGREKGRGAKLHSSVKYVLYIYIVHPIIGDILEGISKFNGENTVSLWDYLVPLLTVFITWVTAVCFYRILDRVKSIGCKESKV